MKRLISILLLLSLSVPGWAQNPSSKIIKRAGFVAGRRGDEFVNASTGVPYVCKSATCTAGGTGWTSMDAGAGGVTNGAGSNVIPKSDGTNLVASSVSDDGTRVMTAEPVGIGCSTNVPTMFVVCDTAATTPRGLMSWQASNDTGSAHFHLRKSRGTFGTPLVVQTNDFMGRVVFSAYDGSAYNESAYIRGTVVGTVAATRVPSKLEFFTSTDALPSVATLGLTLDKDQSATFANTVNATTFVGALTGTASGNLTASNTATLTNKTFDTAGTGNSFSINGAAATANTGTGAVVRATSPTFVTPVLGVATATTVTATTFLANNAGNAFQIGNFGGIVGVAGGARFTFNNGNIVVATQLAHTRQATTGTVGTTTFNFNSGNIVEFTFGAGNEAIAFSNLADGAEYIITMIQDATGSRTATWPASMKWVGGVAPTLSTGAGKRDIIHCYTNGTNVYELSRALDVR
jgi:hypothetical protein